KALPLLTVNVGNVYTNAQAGILLATGFMNTIDKSSLISNTATDKTECYLYFQPQITAQAYNATVQGSLSANNKNGFTTQASTFM
ncbi:lipid A-modifier LpxR family protein, partial [Acinetobacter baumannii]